MTYTLLIDATQKPGEVDRELDLPLRWELSSAQADELARRMVAERNRAGQERMMALMGSGRR